MNRSDNKTLSSCNNADTVTAESLQIKLHAIQHEILSCRKNNAAASGSGKDIQEYNALERQYNSLISELNCK